MRAYAYINILSRARGGIPWCGGGSRIRGCRLGESLLGEWEGEIRSTVEG